MERLFCERDSIIPKLKEYYSNSQELFDKCLESYLTITSHSQLLKLKKKDASEEYVSYIRGREEKIRKDFYSLADIRKEKISNISFNMFHPLFENPLTKEDERFLFHSSFLEFPKSLPRTSPIIKHTHRGSNFPGMGKWIKINEIYSIKRDNAHHINGIRL